MSEQTTPQRRLPTWPPAITALVAILAPPASGFLLASLSGGGLNTSSVTVMLGGIGVTSWLLGMFWYGLPALGLRGGRPLFASIGFAVMGWVVYLIARIVWVANSDIAPSQGAGQAFLYLLIFEAFCVQLWAFGLVFRTVTDWRGALTAAVIAGLLFALLGVLTFSEGSPLSEVILYGVPLGYLAIVLWGIFYGLIRLRTGSLLGAVLIQALQSFTAWHLFLPQDPPVAQLTRFFYVFISAAMLIFIWRLWPREQADYRV